MNRTTPLILNFIIGIALSLLTLNAQAESAQKDFLSDFDTFSVWIKNHASFECNNNPSAVNVMETQIPRILFTGLRAIKKINPELISQKLAQSAQRDLLFSCVPADKTRSWGALYDPTPFYFSLDSFRFTIDGNIILLPLNIIAAIENNTINLEIYDSPTVDLSHSKMTWFAQAMADRSLYSKNAIVHEFLHFLKMDNFSAKFHNSLGQESTHIGFDEDLIYGCADLSFPIWAVHLRHTSKVNKFIKGFDLGKACLICAMASENDGHIRLDQSKFQNASLDCKPYRELKY